MLPSDARQPHPDNKARERRERLRKVFSEQEFAAVEDLCRALGASTATVRRDLAALETDGLIRKVHGGALSLVTGDENLDYNQLYRSCREEKMRIGQAAAKLVADGETIVLSGGSTAAEAAAHLFNRAIHVVTNSIPIAQVFWDCKHVDVTLTGGYLYPRLGVQLGPICDRTLASISADALIMGIAGISEKGLSDSNALIVGSLAKMIEISRRVIIVADHTKFGRDGIVPVAPLSEVDVVVSDTGLAEEHRQMLLDNGIQYVLA